MSSFIISMGEKSFIRCSFCILFRHPKCYCLLTVVTVKSLCSPSAQGTSSGLSLFSSATNVSSAQPSSIPLCLSLHRQILFSWIVQSCDPKCNCKTFLPHLLNLLNVQHAKHSLPCLLYSAVCKGTKRRCLGNAATNGKLCLASCNVNVTGKPWMSFQLLTKKHMHSLWHHDLWAELVKGTC